MRYLIAAVVAVASVARAAPQAPPGPAEFDCDELELCDPAAMSPRALQRCNARAERDRCEARVVRSASQALQAARGECRKPGHALEVMVEAIHVAGLGPKVIDGWATLTDVQRDEFDALVEPLADTLFGGPAERAEAMASLCNQRGIRFKIAYNVNSTVRVTGVYVDGAEHLSSGFYMMLQFERPHRPDETWRHYEQDAGKRAKPGGGDDRRWHYYGDVENGSVDARHYFEENGVVEARPPRLSRELRARLGGGDYNTAMASLRAAQ